MKTPRFLFVVVTVAPFLWGACAGASPAAQPTATVEQALVLEPTATAAPPTMAPIVPATGPTQPQYAPFCEGAPSACEAPVVMMLDTSYCVDKVPYAIMSVQPGTTYESPDLDFQCVDQMHSDGTMRVTCHSVTGKQLSSFDLELCNSACNTPALQMGTGQCPEGYGYDSAKTCCAAPVPANADGCTVYKVDLGACPDAE